MSDNLRRYRAIHQALTQCYPGEPRGRMAQHLTTLAAFISGIVGSKSSQLPSIATKVPARAKPDSRVKRLARWLDNETIKEEVGLDHGVGHPMCLLAGQKHLTIRGIRRLMTLPVFLNGRKWPIR